MWRIALQAGLQATDPHSEYVIFFALPRPKLLQERALMLLL